LKKDSLYKEKKEKLFFFKSIYKTGIYAIW